MIKTFLNWAGEKGLDLPADAGEVTKENRVRTGLNQNYPDAYVRAQYPHKWFNSAKATTDFDLEAKPKTAPANTPG